MATKGRPSHTHRAAEVGRLHAAGAAVSPHAFQAGPCACAAGELCTVVQHSCVRPVLRHRSPACSKTNLSSEPVLTCGMQGFCDNLLTCICRAWDSRKPFLVAPAMNTHMWEHPFTSQQLSILKSLHISIVPPVRAAGSVVHTYCP